ncbi:MAG: 16S rRNA (cytosine(1402)-N(4))-methyltransferase RsmH [Rickettsiaceae bacterium]|nr:16S rRNA (cytosine(1402)-N(4))-methyltransferase RsmH [Rickettsiaceae bacterium]
MDHTPVMLNEVLQLLTPGAGEVHVDCTFGAGGYSKAILDKSMANVIAIDQDPTTEKYADRIKNDYPNRLEFYINNFRNLRDTFGTRKVDGLVLDLGVSSMQLDQADRGFSFMRDSALDMRMSKSGKSAADFINNAEEEEIANVIFEYGDERASRKIARMIARERKIAPIETTFQLAEIVRKCVGGAGRIKIDPATKTFQAIRIWVNDEMEALSAFLDSAEYLLKEGGRLVIVTFHSLEDRMVKRYLQEKSERHVARSKYSTKDLVTSNAPYKLLVKKALKPTEEEVRMNPRARSAKVRAAVKTGGHHE